MYLVSIPDQRPFYPPSIRGGPYRFAQSVRWKVEHRVPAIDDLQTGDSELLLKPLAEMFLCPFFQIVLTQKGKNEPYSHARPYTCDIELWRAGRGKCIVKIEQHIEGTRNIGVETRQPLN